jgi:hypothetical protein
MTLMLLIYTNNMNQRESVHFLPAGRCVISVPHTLFHIFNNMKN